MREFAGIVLRRRRESPAAAMRSLLADASHSISVYGAAYAATAAEMGLRLVSCDEPDLVSQGRATLPANARPQ